MGLKVVCVYMHGQGVIQDFEVGGEISLRAAVLGHAPPPPEILKIRCSEVNSGRFLGLHFVFEIGVRF